MPPMYCNEECPRPREDGDPQPYVCTLDEDHDGPHVAEDLFGNICAAWNGTECLIPSSPCKYAVECGQECPKPREDGDPDPYVCTLADCHEGPHVAEDLYGNICAAWNGTDCLIRPASPQAETKRDCTCLGACRGDEGLSPRYRCVLAPPQAETTKGGR